MGRNDTMSPQGSLDCASHACAFSKEACFRPPNVWCRIGTLALTPGSKLPSSKRQQAAALQGGFAARLVSAPSTNGRRQQPV